VLTGAVRRSSRRSLVDWCAVSGQAPGSGARRQGQGLDEVSTAIHGGAAAVNAIITSGANKLGRVSAGTVLAIWCMKLLGFLHPYNAIR
jgi:hypothetical protein